MTAPRSTVVALGALGVSALVLAACSGGKLSLGNGTGTAQSQLVSASDVSGTVTPCNAGSAHPNVCCSAGPNQASSCVVYPQAPFTQCESGTMTYPDPRSCCPLDGNGNCAAPPPPPLDAGTSSGGGSGCDYVCPPGWYLDSASDGCCQTNSDGSSQCYGSGGTGTSGGGCACACDPDTGVCPPCNCPEQPAPACPSCPPGWQTPQGGDPALCCTTDSNGDIECFSQAGPPGGSTISSVDAGAPSSGSCSVSASSDGAIGPCSCEEQTNGHTYDVSCDPAANVCSCTVDNGAPVSSFADDGNTCGDANMLFTACGFPAP
jgi:hypothetical protein